MYTPLPALNPVMESPSTVSFDLCMSKPEALDPALAPSILTVIKALSPELIDVLVLGDAPTCVYPLIVVVSACRAGKALVGDMVHTLTLLPLIVEAAQPLSVDGMPKLMTSFVPSALACVIAQRKE
jgi:hypothetical protein